MSAECRLAIVDNAFGDRAPERVNPCIHTFDQELQFIISNLGTRRQIQIPEGLTHVFSVLAEVHVMNQGCVRGGNWIARQ